MKEKTADNVQNMYGARVIHSNESHIIEIKESEGFLKGDKLIITTRYGKDLAVFLGPVNSYPAKEEGLLQTFVRKASPEDLAKYEANFEKEKNALKTCKEKILEHKLDMKLVSAHYLLEEKKILFFFTADARVDFRMLVKDLVSYFKMRIELRQIGVRDESRVVGGIAVCGRTYCCHGITDRLRSVSIKMAKEQNLSLNSMKISGPCGRLLCCLSYEYDFYKEEKKRFPPVGTKIPVKSTIFKVIDLNIQSKQISLISEDGRRIDAMVESFFFDAKNKKWRINDVIEEKKL